MFLSYFCHIFDIFLSYSSHVLVIFLEYLCLITFVFLLYSCHISVIFLTYYCHILVILLSVNDIVIFSWCLPGHWWRSISGRYVAEAAGLCCTWAQPRERQGIPVCLPQEPHPFAVSSNQAVRVDHQELGWRVAYAVRLWWRFEFYSSKPNSYWLSGFWHFSHGRIWIRFVLRSHACSVLSVQHGPALLSWKECSGVWFVCGLIQVNYILIWQVYIRRICRRIFCSQDCLATIPPYLYYIGDRGADYDVVASIADPDSMWIVRPQLFFTCTVRPPHATIGRHNKYAEDIALNLVFFSAFEVLRLRTTGTIESNGIRKCMNPHLSPVTPTLYVGRVEDLLGMVPLFPCFFYGNTTSTIQYKYAGHQKQAFEFGCADGQGPASSRGSHVYEINEGQNQYFPLFRLFVFRLFYSGFRV